MPSGLAVFSAPNLRHRSKATLAAVVFPFNQWFSPIA
jgi:hypothetical protein